MASKTKSKKQVRFLLSKGSPLGELHSKKVVIKNTVKKAAKKIYG